MTSYGDTTIEAAFDFWWGGRLQLNGVYFATASEPLLQMFAYLDGAGGDPGTVHFKAVVYDDLATYPNNLVAVSSDVVAITQGDPPGWRAWNFAAGALVNGTGYWIGTYSDGASNLGVARIAQLTAQPIEFRGGADGNYASPETPALATLSSAFGFQHSLYVTAGSGPGPTSVLPPQHLGYGTMQSGMNG